MKLFILFILLSLFPVQAPPVLDSIEVPTVSITETREESFNNNYELFKMIQDETKTLPYTGVNEAPLVLRHGLKYIYTSTDLPEGVGGIHNHRTWTIAIRDNLSEHEQKRVLYHELGHNFGYRTTLHDSPYWEKVYNSEWKNLGVYGSKNTHEAFAETVSIVMTDIYPEGANKEDIGVSIQFMRELLFNDNNYLPIEYHRAVTNTFAPREGNTLFSPYLYDWYTNSKIHQ